MPILRCGRTSSVRSDPRDHVRWRSVYFGARVGVACFRVHTDDTKFLVISLLFRCIFVCNIRMRMKIRIWSTVVSPVVLYECETWCHTLWKERGLRVFENRVLRKQFGPNVEQVTGDGKKLHNEELHVKFSSANKGGSDGHGMWYLWGENFVEGRPRRGCESITKMDVKDIGWGGVDWFDLADGRDKWRAVVNVAVNLGVT